MAKPKKGPLTRDDLIEKGYTDSGDAAKQLVAVADSIIKGARPGEMVKFNLTIWCKYVQPEDNPGLVGSTHEIKNTGE